MNEYHENNDAGLTFEGLSDLSDSVSFQRMVSLDKITFINFIYWLYFYIKKIKIKTLKAIINLNET